jgi:hypothetical protein
MASRMQWSYTSGSEGGPENPTHRELGTALWSDPYTLVVRAGRSSRAPRGGVVVPVVHTPSTALATAK